MKSNSKLRFTYIFVIFFKLKHSHIQFLNTKNSTHFVLTLDPESHSTI